MRKTVVVAEPAKPALLSGPGWGSQVASVTQAEVIRRAPVLSTMADWSRLRGLHGLQSHVPVQDAAPPSRYFLGTLMAHEMDGSPMTSSQSRPGPPDIASVLATADPKPKAEEYAELGISVDSDRLRRVVSAEARPSRYANRRVGEDGGCPADC